MKLLCCDDFYDLCLMIVQVQGSIQEKETYRKELTLAKEKVGPDMVKRVMILVTLMVKMRVKTMIMLLKMMLLVANTV